MHHDLLSCSLDLFLNKSGLQLDRNYTHKAKSKQADGVDILILLVVLEENIS